VVPTAGRYQARPAIGDGSWPEGRLRRVDGIDERRIRWGRAAMRFYEVVGSAAVTSS
jgi:hypothetical protein